MISTAKLTVCFVALAVLAGSAFATPTPERSPPSIYHSPASEIDKSFKSLAGNAEWIFEHLRTIFRTTVGEGTLNFYSWVIDMMVRIEFLVMADGSQLLCRQSDVEQKHREMAIAVSKLLLNLKTMERTDEVLRNVSKTLIRPGPTVEENMAALETMSCEFLSPYFKTMDRLFEEDEMLAVEYKRQKAEAKKEAKPNSRMHEAFTETFSKLSDRKAQKEAILAFLRDKEIIHQAYTNKLFMKAAVKNIAMIFDKTHLERYSLARALIKKASESSDFDSKVNQVYQKALSFRVGGVTYFGRESYIQQIVDDNIIVEALFDAIQKGMEADPTLHREIQASMKQIESTTVYDSEMLHFDFSVL